MSGKEERSTEKIIEIKENKSAQLQGAFELLTKSDNLVITTHVNPDGDAVGSALAVYFYAKQKGRSAHVIIDSEVPFNYKFLEGSDQIHINKQERDEQIILNADTICVVDLNDSKRLKSLREPVLKSKATKMVIDHHMEPREFADHYYVDTDASSAGEMIYNVIKMDDELILDKNIADALYAAIMTDTGSFRFPRTDGDVHRIIADLIDSGADPVTLYDEIYNTLPYGGFRLMGCAFKSTELYYDNQFAIMKIAREDFKTANAAEEEVENIVESSLSIKGVKVGILVTEMPDRNEFRLSFRSKGNYSIRDLAMKFDGGGHFHAAGARVYNSTLDEVAASVINEAEMLFNETH